MKWPEYGIKILFRYPYSGIFRRDLHPDICACFPTLIPSGGRYVCENLCVAARRSALRRVCAFCNEELSPDSGDDDRISHGVCTSCYNHIKASMGVDITEYLTMLDQPVVLVDQDLHILSANQEIRKVTRKEPSSVIGHLCGEVFECEYARCPGGCGNTTHCSGCVIRNSVKETYQTGRPVDKRPATIEQDIDGRPASVSLLISTVKTGDVVLLQVEESSEDCTSGCSDKN